MSLFVNGESASLPSPATVAGLVAALLSGAPPTPRAGAGPRGIAVAVNVADLGIMLALFVLRGWPILAFALAGFVLSVAYTSPPLRLKKRGLGEPTVLVVWGPLMVGGTYYAAVGEVTWEVIAVSIPYALLATSVLMGKHIDKLPWDERDGTRTELTTSSIDYNVGLSEQDFSRRQLETELWVT